ncbi:PGA biosynthesis protein CapA-like [Leguminivora glycinivorella]|uniref:PGA biosynthesis protein CapA-like n=1 Tax=Leguminivora glycinivorella TaxID=1035111 RepID=UPI00200F4455|nr:PGA biosynthesis protein CapA-like [Leguminivora glycinivorella]
MWKRSLSLSCGGDLLAVDVLTPKNTTRLFDDITDFYSSADIVSANLESTIDDDAPFGRIPVKGMPFKMNTHKAMFDKFRNDAKINFFSTATNHAMDLGEDGVLKTLSVLKKSGAYHSGTAASKVEQEDIVVIEKNGLKVALLAFTFDLNGYKVPANAPYVVNVVRFNDVCPCPDYSLIEDQVAIAKAKGADHIVAYCHWGWEFEMYPHVNIVKAAHKVIECGVDTILGNHPHVSQPAEIIERPNMPPALVIYAFGDFVSYHPESRNSKLSYLVKFDIVSYFGAKAAVTNVKALPIYIVNAHLGGDRYDCRIVKFENVLNNPDGYWLTELERNQLPHLRDKVWNEILSPLAAVSQ